MTTDELRELDAKVHRKVMGREIPYSIAWHCDFNGVPFPLDVPHYSTDIAAAWEVVERMRDHGWLFTVRCLVGGYVVNGQEYKLPDDGDWGGAVMRGGFVQEIGDTAPEAIRCAALKAMEAKTESPAGLPGSPPA